mgnify:CR=1 FL=1
MRTAEEHLEWAVRRALEYYDAGDQTNALASFLSDVGKHNGTRHIQDHSATLMILRLGMSEGRSAFEKAMRDFAIFNVPAGSS